MKDLTAIKSMPLKMNDYQGIQQTIGNTNQSLRMGKMNTGPAFKDAEVKTCCSGKGKYSPK